MEDPIHKPDLTVPNLDNVKKAIGKLSESAKLVSFNLDIFPKVVLDEAIKKQEELRKKFNHLHALLNDEIYEAFEKHGYSKEWIDDINNVHRIEVIESPIFTGRAHASKIDIFSVDDVELFKVLHWYDFTYGFASCSSSHTILIKHSNEK